MTEQAAQETCAGMGATTDGHRKLEPFVGTFKAEVKMWMGPGDPMVSTGLTDKVKYLSKKALTILR